MLQKMGHSSVVASNGNEALLLLTTNRFDVVLMDIQMPEMDGLSTTMKIRESERETRMHLPIIAMTAHAMKGDRERCIEAGMDGYVSKPISSQELEEAMAGVLLVRSETKSVIRLEANQEDAKPPAVPSRIVWNMGETLERLGGDEKLFHEVIEIFLDDVPKHMASLRRAIAEGDAADVEGAAHTLKGELGYLGISEVSQKAREMEEFGRTSDLRFAAEPLRNIGIRALRTADLDARNDGRQAGRGDGCRMARAQSNDDQPAKSTEISLSFFAQVVPATGCWLRKTTRCSAGYCRVGWKTGGTWSRLLKTAREPGTFSSRSPRLNCLFSIG